MGASKFGGWLGALLMGAVNLASAGELPLWEAGLGIGMVSFPEYRGSAMRENYALPIPYLVYRGDQFQVDRDRVRGVWWRAGASEWDLSAAASVPVRSRGGSARAGMDDLDPTVELGPQWSYRFRQGATDVTLRMPLRRVFAVDFPHARPIGTVFAPTLALDRDDHPWPGWHASVSSGPSFADRRYVDYYYAVQPGDANLRRPVWQGRSGYAGWQLTTTLTKRFDRVWVGAFVRADDLHGSRFADSPLVQRKLSWSAGIGVSWIIGRSAEAAPASR